MKSIKLLAAASSMMLLYSPAPVFAQGGDSVSLEEIIVTGRKREETLQDIPVSASVVSGTMLADAGITELFDLFELVPGLHYDEGTDRLAGLPSIRGIQAADSAPNRTKVASFIDGIPVLGSAGSIGFNGFQQIEVYRGPQSAAFGRSTFAGAVNYVTRDPGEDFEGDIGINVSDYGTRIINLGVSGPITDSLGFMLNYSKEDSSSPSEFHADGDGGYRVVDGQEFNVNQSDGTEFGARTGDNLAAKFVFEPSDTLKVSLTFNHVETQDQRSPAMFLSEEARNACFNNGGFFANAGMMAPWLVGDLECDWEDASPVYAQHDLVEWLESNPLNLDQIVADATTAGAGDLVVNGETLNVREQALLLAQAYSIPDDQKGTVSDRDRLTFQVEKLMGSGSAIEFSYMQSDETYHRANATGFLYMDPDNFGVVEDGIINTFDSDSVGINSTWDAVNGWTIASGMTGYRVPTPSYGEIEEQYAELRWVSPSEDRLRYVVGASFYDYDFLESRWGGPGMGVTPQAGTAQLHGQDVIDGFLALTNRTVYQADTEIVGESASNTAAFFNIGYDISDRLTASVEGRYQIDDVSATNVFSGNSAEVETKGFIPRVSLAYDLNHITNIYVQWAKGVNPAGVNVDALAQSAIDIVQDGVPNGLIPFASADLTDADADGVADSYDDITQTWYTDATQTTVLGGQAFVSGQSIDDFASYDEEQITQFEIGVKGSLFDGRLSYAASAYTIDWQDQVQNGNVDVDSPCSSNADAGSLAPCEFEGAQYVYVPDNNNATLATSLNFGDVVINGLELEGTYLLSDNWDIRAQASVMKGEYDTFCDIATFGLVQLSASQQATFGVTLNPAGPDNANNCYVTDGKEVANQPQFTGSISPNFTTDIGGMRFNARLDIKHEGSQYDNAVNFFGYPAITTSNLSFGLSGEQWSATLYVNNLTDVTDARDVTGSPDFSSKQGEIGQGTGALTDFEGNPVQLNINTPGSIGRDNFLFQPRAPRTIGIRASYNF